MNCVAVIGFCCVPFTHSSWMEYDLLGGRKASSRDIIRTTSLGILEKGQSPWRIVELNSKIILSLRIELIKRSLLIIHSDSWIFCQLISALVPLPPSKFLHAVTPPH